MYQFTVKILVSDKIPSPSRDEMMEMCVRAVEKAKEKVDTKMAFKRLFVTNALDGSEDHLVSDKVFQNSWQVFRQ